MARKVKDYSKAKIYIIRNTKNDMVYVGSTTQKLCERMALHRYALKYGTKQKYPLYKAFIELGCENFYIELLLEYPCENIEQLLQKEGEYIRKFNSHENGYNKKLSGRTQKEYNNDKKENISKRHKVYAEQNKEQIANKKKQYYEQNHERIKVYAHEYRMKNIEDISKRKKEQVECECGCMVSRCVLAQHKRTEKHKTRMQSITS